MAQVGTPAWLEQHDAVEQLNLQAHLNAQAHADEFVKEACVSLDRLGVLVHELLLAEVGAQRVPGWVLGGCCLAAPAAAAPCLNGPVTMADHVYARIRKLAAGPCMP